MSLSVNLNIIKITVFYTNQPCLEKTYNEVQKAWFGVHRDRYPDNGWGEFHSTRMGCGYDKEVELTPELKKILTEDICKFYGEKAYDKLLEFDLIK